jgi:Integrase core domain
MTRRQGPPSQTWRTFLRNHANAIAAIDLCVVPTLSFERLFAFLVLGHGRRQLLWFAVTGNPTAEWLAQQMVEAFPWDTAPTYLVRDNDRAYGQVFTTRVQKMGIRDRPISPRSPWQNPYAERLIGSLRRDCLDHILIFGERHLLRILSVREGQSSAIPESASPQVQIIENRFDRDDDALADRHLVRVRSGSSADAVQCMPTAYHSARTTLRTSKPPVPNRSVRENQIELIRYRP